MLQKLFGKKVPVKQEGTSFADFIRHASAAERKKVYIQAMKKATLRQQEVIRKAEAMG